MSLLKFPYPVDMPDFECRDCGKTFSLPHDVLDRYPGWTPGLCRDCRDKTKFPKASAPSGTTGPAEMPTDSPTSGVFTDGSCVPNPGPGGWGAVYVKDDGIVRELHGSGGETTNNRMELLALIRAVDLVPHGTSEVVYSDSNVAVRTINEWAASWEKRGWRRKTGAVENLDLVKEAFAAFKSRPELKLVWIRAHVGHRWNEYADELANRGRTEGES